MYEHRSTHTKTKKHSSVNEHPLSFCMIHGNIVCFYISICYTAFTYTNLLPTSKGPKNVNVTCTVTVNYVIWFTWMLCQLWPAKNRELISDQNFLWELFGTRAHVDSLMSVLGWSGHKSAGSDTEPNNEIFLRAVLMGRTELAMLFWRRSKPLFSIYVMLLNS